MLPGIVGPRWSTRCCTRWYTSGRRRPDCGSTTAPPSGRRREKLGCCRPPKGRLPKMRENRRDRPRRDLLMRYALLALLASSACGKPLWQSPLPSLSNEHRNSDEPIEAGIYALLLAEEDARKIDHPLDYRVSLAESTIVARSDSDGLEPELSYLIEERWPDSV